MSDNIFTNVWDNLSNAVDTGIAKAEEGASESLSNWISDTAKNIFNNSPALQNQAKKATGNAIGNWLVDNWKLLSAVVAGLIILAIATRKKW